MPKEIELLKYKCYQVSEDKPWVVFIHGIGGNSRTFSLQLKGLKKHFNLLFPDLRGHGLSRNMVMPESGEYSIELIADDVFKLLQHLKIKKAHFIGCSFGAILIRIMEEKQPEMFISTSMSGAVLRIKPIIYGVFKLGKILAPYINNHFLYTIMAYFIMPRKNHKQSRQVFINQAKLIDPKEYSRWLAILESVKKKLDIIFQQAFSSPTILIMGDQDHAFLKDSIKFSKLHPETKLDIIKHCGHVSNIEEYQKFNELTVEFFNKHTNNKECQNPKDILQSQAS